MPIGLRKQAQVFLQLSSVLPLSTVFQEQVITTGVAYYYYSNGTSGTGLRAL